MSNVVRYKESGGGSSRESAPSSYGGSRSSRNDYAPREHGESIRDREQRRHRRYTPTPHLSTFFSDRQLSGSPPRKDKKNRQRDRSQDSADSIKPLKRNWWAVLPLAFTAVLVLLEPRGGWEAYHGHNNPRHKNPEKAAKKRGSDNPRHLKSNGEAGPSRRSTR